MVVLAPMFGFAAGYALSTFPSMPGMTSVLAVVKGANFRTSYPFRGN